MARGAWVTAGSVAAALAIGAVTPPAQGATLSGGSGGLRVGVTTNPDGGATQVTFNYRVRCTNGRFVDGVVIEPQGDVAFRSTGSYGIRQSGGIRGRVKVHATGARKSAFRWEGRFIVSAVFRQGGRVFARCRLRVRRWAATTPQVRIEMVSDPGDYIGQGRSYAWATPESEVTASATRTHVTAMAGGFHFDFVVPPGARLRPGRYDGAIRYPFNDDKPGLNVSGNGRGCNQLTGDFIVHTIEFTRGGRLAKLDLIFEQHCEGKPTALRGRVTFQR